MKILFVAMGESIHTARWIEQIKRKKWDLYLFPSTASSVLRPEVLSHVNIFVDYYSNKLPVYTNLLTDLSFFGRRVYEVKRFIYKVLDKFIVTKLNKDNLNEYIKKVKPDIIHSLEFQHAGYLVAEAKKSYQGKFPIWVATNWGSDIYLFRKFANHRIKIVDILKNADYYSCECNRDVCLAQGLGLRAKVLPVYPNTGGLYLKTLKKNKSEKTSNRKIVMLKGYQGWSGRAIIGLKALELCQDLLHGYKIMVYSVIPGSDVALLCKNLSAKTGVPVIIVPSDSSHERIINLHGQARISIGLSISDGISTSFLEAMATGSFPIQSNTSCANEWAENNKTAFFVPAEEPKAVAKAIRKALTDDGLVDKAAKENWRTVEKRLDFYQLQKKVIKMYQDIYDESQKS